MSSKKNKIIYSERQKLKQSIIKLLQKISVLYAIALLCGLPLYMEKKYLNMGDAKYHFFQYVSIAVLGFVIVFVVQLIFINFKEKDNNIQWLMSMSATDWCVAIFAIISILSCIFAHYKRYAIFGYSGWNMGLISQLIFVGIFLFISRFYKWSDKVLCAAIAVGGFVFLIAVLQRFDIDILMLYSNKQANGEYLRLDDIYVEKFVSTLGQTSWYSSYAILILPFGMYTYMTSKVIKSRILSGVFLVLGAASLCTVNSDSAYIAIILIFLVFFWYSFDDNESMFRFLEMVLLFIGTFRIIGLLQNWFPERMVHLISGEEKITKFINHSEFVLFLFVTILIIYLFIRWKADKAKKETVLASFDIGKFKWLREVAVWMFIVAVWLVILLMILVTKHTLPDSLSRLYSVSFFCFDENWGNYRGFNWRMAVRAFSEAGIRDKLIGVGPDSFAWSMNAYCKEEVETFWHGLQLACAHNEWLNMLVTEGILGAVAYLGIFVTSAKRLGEKAYKNKLAIPCLAAVLAYIGYNFFCYQTCLCTPYIFMIMGIGEMIIRMTPEGSS